MRRVMFHSYYYNGNLTATVTPSLNFPTTCDYVRIEYAVNIISGAGASVNLKLRENQFNNLTCDVKSSGAVVADGSGILELSNPSPTMSLRLEVAGTTPVIEIEIVVVIGNDC